MTSGLYVRPAIATERATLEALQWRASLMVEENRAALLAHPDAIVLPDEQICGTLVAELDGRIAGFAVVLPRADGDAELDGLFVEPELWRKGVGSRLVREAELFAQRNGARSLFVIAHPRAEVFYLACGFGQIGEHTTRFGPGLVMRKPIAA